MKTRGVLIFLSLLTLGRGVWLSVQGVSPQEAYFWMCGERLAAAFFDGPPGTAFLVGALGFGAGDSMEWLHLTWPVFGFIAAWLAWLLARTLYDDLVAAWTVVTLNALPVFNEHCVTVGPAIPALALVLAGTLAAYSAIEGRRKDWVLAAALFALATLFRYEAVLVPFGLCIAVVATLKNRVRPDPLALAALILIPAAVLWPSMVWNAEWNWIAIAGGTFQTWWRPQPGGWASDVVEYFREFSFGAGLLLAGSVAGLARAAFRPGRHRFLLAVGGPTAFWAIYQFLIGRNFSGAAWFALVPLLIFLSVAGMHWRWMPLAGSVVVVIASVSTGLILREEGLMRGVWSALAGEMHAATREMPASEESGFLIAETAEQAAVLAVYFKATGQSKYPPVFVPESPALTSQFGIWPSYADFIESDKVPDEFFTEQQGHNPFIGRNALYMGADLPQTIKGAFAEVHPLRKVLLPAGGEVLIFLCLNYQTLPL